MRRAAKVDRNQSETARPKERESDIQKTILEGLSALRIWHVRMNSGAMFGAHAGKKWAVRFGRRGMADILATKYGNQNGNLENFHQVIWIECKRAGQKQNPDQVAFQAEIEAEGHRYILAHSWEEVLEALRAN